MVATTQEQTLENGAATKDQATPTDTAACQSSGNTNSDADNTDVAAAPHIAQADTVMQAASARNARAARPDVTGAPSSEATRPQNLEHAVILLCAELGTSVTSSALMHGIPLENGRFPARRVPRALRRLGIAAKVVRMPVSRIADRLLPALVLLKDGGAAVLLRREGGRVELLLPEAGGGAQFMDMADLAALAEGRIILAGRERSHDGPTAAHLAQRPSHWLRGPLLQQWPLLIDVAVAASAANFLAIFTALFAMQVYDRVVPSLAFDTLWILAFGVVIAVGFEFVLRSARASLLESTGRRLDAQISSVLFQQVLGMRLQARPGSTGAFAAQVREFTSVREFFTSATVGAISDLPFAIFFVLMIHLIGGPVAWVVTAAIVAIVLPGLLTQPLLSRYSRDNIHKGMVMNALLLESIEHLETVKTTRAEGGLIRQWEDLTLDLSESSTKARRLAARLNHMAIAVQQLAYVGVVVAGVYLIAEGTMTMGALIACSLLSSRAVGPMLQVAGLLSRWQHVKLAMEGLEQVMGLPVERPHSQTFVQKPYLDGGFELEGVKMRHQPEGAAVLDVPRLSIAPGERIALLGGNGAGKSTLLRVLAGLVEPQEGSVEVDRIAMRHIDPADRQRLIGYLPQDVGLFYGTLRSNLTLDGRAREDDEILNAIEMVGLDGWVRRNPFGLDMPITGPSALSGGQRQAIGLARLILQDPAVILLDEPTAAFDQRAEAQFLGAMKDWLGSRTLVVATHKRALLDLTGRAIVLGTGRITQDGPLTELIADEAADALAEKAARRPTTKPPATPNRMADLKRVPGAIGVTDDHTPMPSTAVRRLWASNRVATAPTVDGSTADPSMLTATAAKPASPDGIRAGNPGVNAHQAAFASAPGTIGGAVGARVPTSLIVTVGGDRAPTQKSPDHAPPGLSVQVPSPTRKETIR